MTGVQTCALPISWNLCSRIKRGLKDTSKQGAFTKDSIYYPGSLKVKEFLKLNPLKDLYYGKIPVNLVNEVKMIEGLQEPKWLPLELKAEII